MFFFGKKNEKAGNRSEKNIQSRVVCVMQKYCLL
jgi:hypothetical protein